MPNTDQPTAETVELARDACRSVDDRIRDERFAERALIVEHLAFVLPDTAETREAIADVFSGEHRRAQGR
jgi:hypothetical protein